MSQGNGTLVDTSAMAASLRGPESPAGPGGVVWSPEGQGPVGRPFGAAPSWTPGDSRLPPQPHPQAALPPGAPRRTRAIEVDAATVDCWLKERALALFREDGWKGSDADFLTRVHVVRVDSGGVSFEVRG